MPSFINKPQMNTKTPRINYYDYAYRLGDAGTAKMSGKKKIFECTRPENVKDWEDCKICLYAKCGFSLCFEPNPKWKEQNGMCPYEHCIENSDLLNLEEDASCPIFGHGCPGGRVQVIKCGGAL